MADTFTISRTGKATILKDPNALLDYTFDWTDWLTSIGYADAIVTVEFEITQIPVDDPTPPVVSFTEIINGKLAVAWVYAGTPLMVYGLRCRIFTSGGRIDDRTVYLKIKER